MESNSVTLETMQMSSQMTYIWSPRENFLIHIAQESTTPTHLLLMSSILLIAHNDPQVIASSMWHTSVGLSYQ